MREGPHDLERAGEAERVDPMGRQPRDGPPAEGHPASIGVEESREQAEDGRLPRPVGPDQPEDLLRSDAEGHLRDGGQAAEALGEAARLEEGSGGAHIRYRRRLSVK